MNHAHPAPVVRQLTPRQVSQSMGEEPEIKLLDVRTPAEYEIAYISGAILVTDEQVQDILTTWPKDACIICYCHHGIRSQRACDFLQAQGFRNLANMVGGIDAWSLEMDSSLPRYRISGE